MADPPSVGVAEEPGPSSTKCMLDADVRREHAVAAEYALVAAQPINGIYVQPSVEDPLEWSGVIFVHRGPYQGGIFRFSLHLPHDFPQTEKLPRIVFDRPLHHPLVDERNTLQMTKYFEGGWRPDQHRLYHVLAVLHRCMHRVDAEKARAVAGDRHKFAENVEQCIIDSRRRIYDGGSGSSPTDDCPADTEETPQPTIQFSPWNADVHGPLRQAVVQAAARAHGAQLDSVEGAEFNASTERTRSWVDPESMMLLSK